MSISDQIVVMKDGSVQQTAGLRTCTTTRPTSSWPNFSARRPSTCSPAGCPAEGSFWAMTRALDVPGAPDGPVTAAIRPEGFVPDAGGVLRCGLKAVEVMGRDVSVVCTHPAFEGPRCAPSSTPTIARTHPPSPSAFR